MPKPNNTAAEYFPNEPISVRISGISNTKIITRYAATMQMLKHNTLRKNSSARGRTRSRYSFRIG